MPKLSRNPAPKCPHCESANTVNNGTRNGRQRCKCRDCDRTFTVSDGSRPGARKHLSDRAATPTERSKAFRERQKKDEE